MTRLRKKIFRDAKLVQTEGEENQNSAVSQKPRNKRISRSNKVRSHTRERKNNGPLDLSSCRSVAISGRRVSLEQRGQKGGCSGFERNINNW